MSDEGRHAGERPARRAVRRVIGGGLIVAAIAGTVAFVASRRTVPVPPMSDCAGVVRVVSSERVTDEDADRVAGGLADCLEQIGEVAVLQYKLIDEYEHEPDPRGFGRPKVTAMFSALAGDEGRRDRLRESFAAWGQRRLAPLVSGPLVDEYTGNDTVLPISLVMASVATAIGDEDGQEFIWFTSRRIQRDMAQNIASAIGQPPPASEDVLNLLRSRFRSRFVEGSMVDADELPLERMLDQAGFEARRKRDISWW